MQIIDTSYLYMDACMHIVRAMGNKHTMAHHHQLPEMREREREREIAKRNAKDPMIHGGSFKFLIQVQLSCHVQRVSGS